MIEPNSGIPESLISVLALSFKQTVNHALAPAREDKQLVSKRKAKKGEAFRLPLIINSTKLH